MPDRGRARGARVAPNGADFGARCALRSRPTVGHNAAVTVPRRSVEPASTLASVGRRARALARSRGLDPAGIERLLGVAPDRTAPDAPPFGAPDEIGGALERALGAREIDGPRKATGAYFTPRALAAALAGRTLARLRADAPRTLDPAAGAGAVLLATLRTLRQRSGMPVERLAGRLHAIEIDPIAARLCRLALWLECADPDLDPALFERTVRVGDPLLAPPPGRVLAPAALAALAELAPDRGQPLDVAAAWPEVGSSGGFDLVIGNPPWQIAKPDSRAFFARFDPEHRHHGKQTALRVQRVLCERDPSIAAGWRHELEQHAAFARFCRARFRLQGRSGDPNLYKLFIECGLDLLRPGGRLGMLVPAGLHADLGARELRTALMNEHRWRVLWGFENRARLFPDIDARFKFDAIVVEKGGRTTRLRAAFMQDDPGPLAAGAAAPLSLGRRTLQRLAPRSRVVPELRSREELMLLERIHAHAVALGDGGPNGWRLSFRRELDMTLDSADFVPRDELEARGLVSDGHGRWLAFRRACHAPTDPGDGELLLLTDGRGVRREDVIEAWVPVWEGRMVDAFDPSAKGWLSGRARRARWAAPGRPPFVAPQYLVPAEILARVDPTPSVPKVGFLAIGSATNTRTMIASALCRAACGNSVPVLRSGRGDPATLALCAVLCSMAYDFALRARLGGTNLNRFTLDETPLPVPDRLLPLRSLPWQVAALCWSHPRFAEGWQSLRTDRPAPEAWPPVPAGGSRLACRAALDAIVAAAFGLSAADLAWIAKDAWRPSPELRDRRVTRRLDPKGLWRVDRDRPPELRLPVLAIAARIELDRVIAARGGDWSAGAECFLRSWRLPETVDLRALGFEAADPGERAVEVGAPNSGAVDAEASWRRAACEARRAAALDTDAGLDRW